jgi:endonuclease YncB( thermonuclease family)
VHLKVDPTSAFLFSSAPGKPAHNTQAFVGSTVFDHWSQKVITSKREIKVRLQDIDTPELHYPVIGTAHQSKKGTLTNEFRQPFGASAANALHDYLTGYVESEGTSIRANLVTRINAPGEAIDSHGRFVGDIMVGTGFSLSINTWLVTP